MKTIRQASPALILSFIPLLLAGQEEIDPVGWWRNTTETPAGEISTTIRLDYFDGELSGSFSNTFINSQLPIFDSSLEGNKVVFKVQLIGAVMLYEGEIDGDGLTISSRVIEGELPGVPEVTTMTFARSD